LLWAGCILACLPIAAQYQRPSQELTADEKEAIEVNRRLAGPRPTFPHPALSPIEAARVAVFKAARNSVVYIASITRKWYLEDNRTGDRYAVPPASGTGIVWDNLGHVVTNHHVITLDDATGPRGEAEELQVTLADGKTYKAVVIGRSLTLDIAVLHVFAPLGAMKPLPIGSSHNLQVGQSVLAIGNPFGLDHSLTSGIISALGRPIFTGFNTRILDAVQTDAAINPGNSGGPLLDRAGRLIGMNTAISSTSGNSAGIGFAIPVDTLNKVVPRLIAKGQLHRPELGFTSLTAAATASLGAKVGIAVDSVTPGSLADKAGLRGLRIREGAKAPVELEDVILGDVIVGFRGHTVEGETQLMDLLEMEPPEAVLEFDVQRDGKQIKIILKPGDDKSTDQPKPAAIPVETKA
jgi:S1-C subfamily serine protease